MSKSKNTSNGFEKDNKRLPTENLQEINQNLLKEQQALDLINQGQLKEAEQIYRELVAAGSNNHIVYGNLAALCEIRGNKSQRIELLNKALEINNCLLNRSYG